MRTTFIILAVFLGLTAAALAAEYTISQEDILSLTVWGEPQLTGLRLVVGPDGMVSVPVIGSIKAEGLTADQLAEKIKAGLKEKQFLMNAQVQVLLMDIHRPTVSVVGMVNRPGKYEFKEGDTVIEAIAQAGSYQDAAGLANAALTRKSGEVINLNLYKMYFKGDMTQNLQLKKGDTIYVPEETARRIYVLGEVQRPGMYPLKENMTALTAISLAGGAIPERGYLKGTTIVRGASDSPETVKVNFSKLIGKGDLSQDVPLQPGDLVYVPKSKKPNLQDIASVISVLSNFRFLTQGFGR